MCIARAWFAIFVECVAGEGAIVIARPVQEKQFLHFFSIGVAANALARPRDGARSNRLPK
jgi:hypothetical protein